MKRGRRKERITGLELLCFNVAARIGRNLYSYLYFVQRGNANRCQSNLAWKGNVPVFG